MAAAFCLLVAGCGHVPQDDWPARPAYLGDARFEEQASAAYAPAPDDTAPSVDRPRALRAGGRESQARSTALTFARALFEGDEPQLAAMLPARVVQLIDRSTSAREQLIERCLKDARTLVYGQDRDPAALIDIDAITVTRAEARIASILPLGVRADDLLVTLPRRSDQADNTSKLPCLATLIIRSGATPIVIGVAR